MNPDSNPQQPSQPAPQPQSTWPPQGTGAQMPQSPVVPQMPSQAMVQPLPNSIPQPQVAAQPQAMPQVYPVAPQHGSRTAIIVILCVILALLLIAGGVAAYFLLKPSTGSFTAPTVAPPAAPGSVTVPLTTHLPVGDGISLKCTLPSGWVQTGTNTTGRIAYFENSSDGGILTCGIISSAISSATDNPVKPDYDDDTRSSQSALDITNMSLSAHAVDGDTSLLASSIVTVTDNLNQQVEMAQRSYAYTDKNTSVEMRAYVAHRTSGIYYGDMVLYYRIPADKTNQFDDIVAGAKIEGAINE